MTRRTSILLACLALAFFAWHFRGLPPALEDPDSINFAMAVESFDVSRHQPHPPGYAVYVALTKASTRLVGVLMPQADRDRRAAVGLSIWSLVAGAAGAFVMTRFWLVVGLPLNLAWLAAVLAMSAPLYAISSVRPLTDMVGLVAALIVQTWLLSGWRQVRSGEATLPRVWMAAAVALGLIPGLRSQALWLTAPLAAWAMWELVRLHRWSHLLTVAALAVGGLLLWLVPMTVVSGGLGSYLRALGSQGSEDLVGVEMLSKIPTFEMLQYALSRTFLVPWQLDVVGQLISALAVIGTIRLARVSPGILAGIGLAFWPYLVLHLTFQEVLYTRYALPLLIPVSGLAIVGVAAMAGRATSLVALSLASVGVVVAQPNLRSYAGAVAPLSAAVRDMIAHRRDLPDRPELTMHHPLWWSSRRTLDWYGPRLDVPPQPFPGDREWLRVVDHFLRGDETPVWFLADLSRTDLALLDWRSLSTRGVYVRQPSLQRMIGGDLLEDARWLEITRPGWMLGRGWALTAEIRGATALDGREPNRQPADAWLRRSPGSHRLTVGGRYLGGTVAATLVVSIDGREAVRWDVPAAPAHFVRWYELPEGALDGQGPYARVTMSVESADGRTHRPELSLEQFDFGPAGGLIYALNEGWQEPEVNPATGMAWRWSSERNTITFYGGGRDVRLRLAGESPLRYFARAPIVQVTVGGEPVARFEPDRDFDETIVIPARLLTTSPAVLEITTDQAFVPAESGNSPDRRRLGLRLFAVELRD